jgi:two-component system, OmpR family, phosphate regulon sensor histidine kinase PhoR
MMKIPLKYKLSLIHLLLIAVVSLFGSFFTVISIQRYYQNRLNIYMETQLSQVQSLLEKTELASISVPKHYAALSDYAHAASFRLTLIDSAGTVRFDSNVSADSLGRLENHRDRPEVRLAMRDGFGHDQRLSTSLHQPFYYGALRLKLDYLPQAAGESVRYVRIAYPLADIHQQFHDLRLKIIFASVAALIFIGLFSFWLAGRLSYPIQKLAAVAEKVKRGDLEANFQHKSRDEIGQLADLLNQMLGKLREDLVQLRKLEQVRSQFLGNVSHELRTPIFALQGYLETLLNSKFDDPDQQKEFIAKAYQQSARLNNLLTDLIDISRIESGEMKMIFRPFDVNALLGKLVEELQSKANTYDVTVTFVQSGSDEKIMANGDPERLTQVINNLAENAIKYNVQGGRVEIGWHKADEKVEIYVADTGRGIPREHLPRIFERFYRVDKERSRAVGGTGLGLAIVKHIIEAHGSRVEVQSEVNKGSRFSFALTASK